LDATNEFSDIPMIEGALRMKDAKDASRINEALLRWTDISSKVDVRVFSIKTLVRGFSDISVIPEVNSSFFGETFLLVILLLDFLTSMKQICRSSESCILNE
jgi:hypothetical protein